MLILRGILPLGMPTGTWLLCPYKSPVLLWVCVWGGRGTTLSSGGRLFSDLQNLQATPLCNFIFLQWFMFVHSQGVVH